MNYKMIMLATLLLLAILTLGVVSAADDADALAVEDDGEVIESPIDENDIIAEDTDDDVLGDGEKYNVTINIDKPDEIYFEDDVSISVWIDYDWGCEYSPEGDIILYLNGEEVSRDSADEGMYYHDEFYQFGVYNFRVEYTGDDNFNPAFEEFTYNVTNSMYRINLPSTVSYGSKYFYVEAPVLNPGEIEITINGKKFNVFRDDYEYTDEYMCNASALRYGLNTVTVYYPGDEKFGEYLKDKNITFISSAKLNRDFDNPEWGEPVEIYIDLPSDATGTLKVYSVTTNEEYMDVFDEIASANLKDGLAVAELTNLHVGVNRVYANFTGSVEVEDNYFSIYVAPLVTVPKAIITGEDKKIIVSTSKDDEAIVNVSYVYDSYGYEDEEDYVFFDSVVVSNGQAEVSLASLKSGKYSLWIQYLYDEYECFDKTYSLYVVDNYDVNLTVDYFPENILVNDDSNYVYFDIAPYAEGNVSLYVDGVFKENITLVDEYNYFNLNASGLSLGKHTVSLNYTNEIFGDSSYSAEFNVVPATIRIPDKMNINSYVSRNDIGVSVHENAKGTLTILVDNKQYLVKEINEVKDDTYYYSYGLSNVSRGKHSVSVTYDDEKYGKVSESKNVDFGYEISIYGEWEYGKDNIIYIYPPKDIGNGDFTITVDGVKYDYVRNLSQITANPSKLSYGKHIIIVKYAGDNFYPEHEFNETLDVFSEIKGFDGDFIIGSDKEISLTLPGDAKGKLNVTIEVEDYDEFDNPYYRVYDSRLVSFENGKASYSLAELPLGEYKATVEYTGNDYLYDSSRSPFYFTVSSVDWGDYDLDLGENKTITFIAKDDGPAQLRIVLSRNIDPYAEWDDPINIVETVYVNLTDGKASYTFTNLVIGYHHIFLAEEYIDGGLKGFQGGFDFKVRAPEVDAEDEKAVLGKITPAVIYFHDYADGNVAVNVRTNLTKDIPDVYDTYIVIVDGKTTIDLNKIIKDAGYYEVIFSYRGNCGEFESYAYYYNVTDDTREHVTITIDSVFEIVEGSDLDVKVLIPGATGTVAINGNNHTLVSGTASTVISNVKEGTLTIKVNYFGDDKHFAASASRNVNVFAKLNPDLQATAADINVGQTATVSISINANVTGKVTVNGKTVVITKGKGTAQITDLAVGNHSITVSFDGDSLFKAQSINVPITVKAIPKIVAKDASLDYTGGKYYQVTVYGEDGNIAAGTQVIFTLNGKQVAKVNTDPKGVAKFKVTQTPVSNAKIVSTALGVSVTKKLTIKHIVTLKTTTVKKSAKKITLQATLKVNGKALKNKKITFKFNGKKVKTVKTTSKGIAKVTVSNSFYKKLKVGKKVTYTATYSKDTVSKSVKIKK